MWFSDYVWIVCFRTQSCEFLLLLCTVASPLHSLLFPFSLGLALQWRLRPGLHHTYRRRRLSLAGFYVVLLATRDWRLRLNTAHTLLTMAWRWRFLCCWRTSKSSPMLPRSASHMPICRTHALWIPCVPTAAHWLRCSSPPTLSGHALQWSQSKPRMRALSLEWLGQNIHVECKLNYQIWWHGADLNTTSLQFAHRILFLRILSLSLSLSFFMVVGQPTELQVFFNTHLCWQRVMGPLNPGCFDCFPLACPVLASFSTSFSTYAFPFQILCLDGTRFLPNWHKFFWLIAATYIAISRREESPYMVVNRIREVSPKCPKHSGFGIVVQLYILYVYIYIFIINII